LLPPASTSKKDALFFYLNDASFLSFRGCHPFGGPAVLTTPLT